MSTTDLTVPVHVCVRAREMKRNESSVCNDGSCRQTAGCAVIKCKEKFVERKGIMEKTLSDFFKYSQMC